MTRSDIAAELTGVEDAWAEAIASNDADQIGRFMSDDWVIVSSSGVGTRDDLLSVIRSGELTHSAMDRVSEPQVRVVGDVVIFTARVTNTAHYGGQTFYADEWTTDVFRHESESWICVYSHITPAAD